MINFIRIIRKRERWRVPRGERVCRQCQKLFVYPSTGTYRVYCGHECARKGSYKFRHGDPIEISARNKANGTRSGVLSRAKAATKLILHTYANSGVLLAPDERKLMLMAMGKVHRVAYKRGYQVGLRKGRAGAFKALETRGYGSQAQQVQLDEDRYQRDDFRLEA